MITNRSNWRQNVCLTTICMCFRRCCICWAIRRRWTIPRTATELGQVLLNIVQCTVRRVNFHIRCLRGWWVTSIDAWIGCVRTSTIWCRYTNRYRFAGSLRYGTLNLNSNRFEVMSTLATNRRIIIRQVDMMR